MRRRRFITSLASVVVLPVVARAQQTVTPVIGILGIGSPDVYKSYLAAFRQGLNETGYVEDQNVAIEYRWGNGDFNRMPALTSDLVNRQVDVIVAGASTGIAKAATTKIPIVGFSNGDPVKYGLVASYNRPGGNVTIINLLTYALGPKRFELLRELLPNSKIIAVLANPNNPDPEAKTDLREVEAAARRVGQELSILNAGSERDFEPAFTVMSQQGAAGLLVMADPFFNNQRSNLVALAQRHSIPAMYEWHEFAVAGGLMSYGGSLPDAYRQMGIYAGKILKGAKPADLPVIEAVKIELVLNLKTAKALNLNFPITLLGLADEVIE